ncbi:PREDICTED: wiskott-Aldrich syndrome protein family member 1 isoform X1 [Drosophila arizonae]|uniref:Wiskott-Aldrich syndrome protein family member n=1 Tax=Drosophila arizonae TaxID=7263 RepID=A0ABM1NTZ5_DROAR|nr:PREDICTED: wiskott-Aldrich syndrome protein family member 1 isoform X1 [Drosophila arizonae]XP_017858432.1 PREDICTED: wiskott-Aldrich syndrome protein family member 1 isoform X1 [Drosophila arizonae]
MPLPKRSIEPVHVARSVYQQDELQSVELETVTNTTLTNIIRQLSSLSKHAEDVFGELARDVGNIGDRANSLQARIDRLAIKVTQLDSTVEEVPLTDITRKKAFKSAKVFDQQIFSRSTMPALMLETYAQCDKPPPLDKLNVYRDDGKDGLKFYTDPDYFFELWRQEMIKDTERVMHDKGKKTHRPRQEGAGGGQNNRHNKRVRTPHNTREKQRQIALGHGETLMPNNVIYRTPNAMPNEEAGYGTQLIEIQTVNADCDIQLGTLARRRRPVQQQPANIDGVYQVDMGIYDSRPLRPNSIELRRSYQSEQIDGSVYEPLTPQTAANQYAAAYGTNGISAASHMHMQQQQQQQQQQLYDSSLYHQSHGIYGQSGQGAMSPEQIYGPGTPSRTKPRPSQPPPAPPSNGSGGGTPTASNANTPTRGRSMSTSRDALPPPPPVPDVVSPMSGMNGMASGHMAAKLLGRTNSTSRAGSPQMAPSNSAQNANDMVMAQLSNTFNSMGITNSNQLNSLSDLPPPPPVPDQHSPKMSPPNVAPPPPPPPPPVEEGGLGAVQMQSHPHQIMPKALANGELQLCQPNGGSHIVSAKKIQAPFHDPRNDLMKAIRDGIILRKVEKSELKEIERNTAMLDVASILARRVAIELSESEDSDSEDDSEGWMETNETSA